MLEYGDRNLQPVGMAELTNQQRSNPTMNKPHAQVMAAVINILRLNPLRIP